MKMLPLRKNLFAVCQATQNLFAQQRLLVVVNTVVVFAFLSAGAATIDLLTA